MMKVIVEVMTIIEIMITKGAMTIIKVIVAKSIAIKVDNPRCLSVLKH